MPAYRHTETGVLILVDDLTATFLADEWVAEPLHGFEDPTPAPAPAEETPDAVDETPVEEAPVDGGDTSGTGAFAKTRRK
mgnify:CR=1 FL=1